MAESPVDELMRALEDISRRAETASRGGWRSWAIGRANKALNRFNAERGDGVWVPKYPDEAMALAGLQELPFGPSSPGHAVRCYRAMIAASEKADT